MTRTHSGSCHCGKIRVALTTNVPIEAITPRQCGCGFCLKHPANWFADPNGSLAIAPSVQPNLYQFGTKTADFLICPDCGVIVAATCSIDGTDFGILNLNCLDGEHVWPIPESKSDFDGEGTGDRLARRAKNWMPVTLMERA